MHEAVTLKQGRNMASPLLGKVEMQLTLRGGILKLAPCHPKYKDTKL
jgi:hypothetical protein